MTARAHAAALFLGPTRAALVLRMPDRSLRVTDRAADAGVVRELLAELPEGASVTVVLGRPLAHLRVVELPPMSRDMAERVLARDWERYVIGDRGPHVVAARQLERGRWCAAFVPAQLLSTIRSAASERKLAPVIVTVDDVLAAAAKTLLPARFVADALVVVMCDSHGPTDVVAVRDGSPLAGRTLLPGASAKTVAAFADEQISTAATFVVLGVHEPAHALVAALGKLGHRAVASPSRGSATSAPVAIAELALDATPALPLRADEEREQVRHRDRATVWWLGTAIAAALVFALFIESATISARLRHVTAERKAIAPQVARAVASRDSMQRNTDLLADLAVEEANASRVGGVLAEVALALPAGTSVATLQVSGDSLTLDGEGPNGNAVYDALRNIAALDQVRLTAPIRQQRSSAEAQAVDHFGFAARIRNGSR